ncbi:MAG: hypothetical protein K2N01_04845 [Lachnospiraceae bacterium]|nr:hypothetical protein [Lachnospiraceae bacterium]
MDIENMLLSAISKQEIISFLRGEGEYMVENFQYAPGAGLTDVGKVLSKGVYKIYVYNNIIKPKFEESLLQMIDNSDFDMYLVCLYLISQLFKEKNGLSPFTLSKDLIVEKLSIRIKERELYIKKGIEYPNGYVNTNAMAEIQRFRLVSKEEYNIIF